jgi:hypothetical protein
MSRSRAFVTARCYRLPGAGFRAGSSLGSDKPQFRGNLDERCRALNDGEDLVAGRASEYVQLGQGAEAGNGPCGVHDLAAVRARAFFGRAIHPANSDPFTPGSLSSHSVAEREMGWSRLSTVLTAHSSLTLPLEYEEILPRQERMGGNQRIASTVEFRDGFFRCNALLGWWSLRRIDLEVYYRDPPVRR